MAPIYISLLPSLVPNPLMIVISEKGLCVLQRERNAFWHSLLNISLVIYYLVNAILLSQSDIVLLPINFESFTTREREKETEGER